MDNPVEDIDVTLLPEPDQPDPGELDPTDAYVEGPNGPAVLAATREHQGKPYAWSGRGEAGFAAGGLVEHVSKEQGVPGEA